MPLTLQRLARRFLPRPVRNWLRSPRGTARRVLDGLRFRAVGPVTAELRPGWRLRCHPTALRTAYIHQTRDPAQVAELDAFLETIEADAVLFDLGAHYGLFSLAALHFGGPDARAFAVEPSPTATRMITTHATLNHVADRLTIVSAAVSDREGSIDMVATGVVGAGYFVRPDATHPAGDRTSVPTVTVDGLARRSGCAPTHLKIDIEGFEEAALRGAAGTLAAAKAPLVFLELHVAMIRSLGGDPREPLTLLRRADYRTFRVGAASLPEEELLRHDLVRLIAIPHREPVHHPAPAW